MPPKAKFTKDEIINAALNITNAKGIDAVTARDIAAELGVSTRPIFTYFSTMDEVKTEVCHAAWKVYHRYIQDGLRMKVPFLGYGISHLKFAREEPELYKLLFLTPPNDGISGAMSVPEHLREQVIESIRKAYNMDVASADRYFRDMRLAAYGLASLIVTGNCPYSDEDAVGILTDMSLSLCKACKEIFGFSDGSFDRDVEFEKLIEK